MLKESKKRSARLPQKTVEAKLHNLWREFDKELKRHDEFLAIHDKKLRELRKLCQHLRSRYESDPGESYYVCLDCGKHW